MMDLNGKRPSNFVLSRYILNESDADEKHRIESWIASSEEARIVFEEFKARVAEEERMAVPIKPFHKRELKLFHPNWFTKPAWAISFGLALLVVAAITFIIPSIVSRNTSHDLLADNKSLHTTQQILTFRDTLETLLQITTQMLRQSDWTIQLIDSQAHAGRSFGSLKRLPTGFFGADKTAVILE